MKTFVKEDDWKIIEERYPSEDMRQSESLMSIANGEFGIRGSFEEHYSGDSLKGSYIAGVYYPDKTKVGWWKIGYPENFNKSPNSTHWSSVRVWIDGQEIDLATTTILSYHRELNMRKGVLRRKVTIATNMGKRAVLESQRMCSISDKRLGLLMYSVRALDEAMDVRITSYLDANVMNEGSNYDEYFWNPIAHTDNSLTMETRKSHFRVCWAMYNTVNRGQQTAHETTDQYIGESYQATIGVGDIFVLNKFVGIASNVSCQNDELEIQAQHCIEKWSQHSADYLFMMQAEAWNKRWDMCDIAIDGDTKAQQGVRFCLFQLLQTYDGTNPLLNIAPKGFSGEKYAGGTYWDTEAYLMPFYTLTLGPQITKNLLLYRYHHLDKAILNANKLGFTSGAALYPMVTFNGEECHNEWEVTFEEIHRNGAIAYAIYQYTHETGDTTYLAEYGAEVLVALARFWRQRVNFSHDKQQYVILGVTGPNEYENNINNNWYTNYIAAWSLRYASQSLAELENSYPGHYEALIKKCNIDPRQECKIWEEIAENIYLPTRGNLIVQHDGFMDKELINATDIPIDQRPLNQHWSWDRILRSCFIKQADVLQGLFFFEKNFSKEMIAENYDFYEPMTVHESSLSPSVHATLACAIGKKEAAYEMFMRMARLDIDDYNNELHEGLHITSMGGTWFSVVRGFAGMTIEEDAINFSNRLPDHWKSLTFRLLFRGELLSITIDSNGVHRKKIDSDKL